MRIAEPARETGKRIARVHCGNAFDRAFLPLSRRCNCSCNSGYHSRVPRCSALRASLRLLSAFAGLPFSSLPVIGSSSVQRRDLRKRDTGRLSASQGPAASAPGVWRPAAGSSAAGSLRGSRAGPFGGPLDGNPRQPPGVSPMRQTPGFTPGTPGAAGQGRFPTPGATPGAPGRQPPVQPPVRGFQPLPRAAPGPTGVVELHRSRVPGVGRSAGVRVPAHRPRSADKRAGMVDPGATLDQAPG